MYSLETNDRNGLPREGVNPTGTHIGHNKTLQYHVERIIHGISALHDLAGIGAYFMLMPYKEAQEFPTSFVLIHYLSILITFFLFTVKNS